MRVFKIFMLGVVLLALAVGTSEQAGLAQADCSIMVKPGESIQRAIDAAAEGTVICLTAGTWEENLTIQKSLTLRGIGKEPKDVQIVGVKDGYPVIRIEGESEIEVFIGNLTATKAEGLCAAYDSQWICPVGLQALGKAKVVIKDMQVFSNMDGLFVGDSATVSLSHSTVSDNTIGLEVRGSATMSLTDSTVSSNGDGLNVRGSATVSLSYSAVSDNRDDGLQVWHSATVTLTNSTVSGNGWDGLVVEDSATVEIKESIINDNKHCGIYVDSLEAQVRGTPKTMQGNGADLCGFAPAHLRQPSVPQDPRPRLAVPADYPTIQQAIDAIVPGGTIEIAAGTYKEGLTIWKPLVLRGAGQDKTILRALPERKLALSIIAEVQGVRIEGLRVRGSQEDGLLIYGREVAIQGVTVSDNEGDGLAVGGSATVSLSHSQVSRNDKNGIIVRDQAQVSLQGSQVSNNVYGLHVEDKAQLTIATSRVSGNRDDGLWVGDEAQVTITNSQVSGNSIDGLWVTGSAQVSLTDSLVSYNRGDGLQALDSATVSLSHSIISHNGDGVFDSGLFADGAAYVSLVDSAILDNEDTGINVRGEAHLHLVRSRIENNKECGINLDLGFGPSIGVQVFWSGSITGWGNVFSRNGQDACNTDTRRLSRALPSNPHSQRQVAVPQDVPTIQGAIDLVADGGTITVAPGTYNETLEIFNLSFILQGADASQVRVISGEGRGPTITAFSEAAGEIRLEGLTISSPSSAGLFVGGVSQMTLSHLQISESMFGIWAVGSTTLSLTDVQVSKSKDIGLFVAGSTYINVEGSQVSDSEGVGFLVAGRATVTLRNSQVVGHKVGLECVFLAQCEAPRVSLINTIVSNTVGGLLFFSLWGSLSLANSQVYKNGGFGLLVLGMGKVKVEVRQSLIVGNGTHPDCLTHSICNGITVGGKVQLTLGDSVIKENTDWGLAALLGQCGYDSDAFTFIGQVVFEGQNVIEGNNTSGNQNGMGNPGNHPWNRPDVPDGQVCLP